MRIKKYDFDYGRRTLLDKTLRGISAGGVIAPLWPLISEGADISKAYPEELVHIEAYTKGKVKVGDHIDASNVDVVKDLVDPVMYQQIKTMGRRLLMVDSTSDASTLYPYEYLQATVRNRGKARLDAAGNIWNQQPGQPWIGGLPFPEPQSGYEAVANITLSWGRHDYSTYAFRDWDITPEGEVAYQYDFAWLELNTTARVDGAVFENMKDLLRLQTVWFTSPQDSAGTSFLSVWKYDQRAFPELYGYLPAFKRVRQFPTNQRFEPLVPGITLFLSDAWGSGDPMATWGNYKIVARKPCLGAISGVWNGGHDPNWELPTHGGPKGKTFWEYKVQLVPEAIIVEVEPTGYPRAPVSKRRLAIDARNGMLLQCITFDRRGQVWKQIDAAFGQFIDGRAVRMDRGHPAWSVVAVHIHDFQTNRMSRFVQCKQITGGHRSDYGEGSRELVDTFFTPEAMQRLGARST